MAEQALKKLEEQLICSICLDTFTDPKLLQCFHVYCQQCLVPLGDRDQQGQLILSCPTCRQVTPIPPRGVAGLQSAFHISHLLEIQDSVKKLPNSPPDNLEGAVGGVVTETSTQFCFQHVKEELKLYCETCGELVCYKCALKGGKHYGHDYAELNQAFEKYMTDITSSIEPMEKRVMIIKNALALIEQRCGEISDQREVIENKIHVTFRRLREVLTVRETELIGQLHHMTQGKLKDLASQSDLIEITLGQLYSCLHFMRESIGRVGNKSDVLMMKTNTVHQIKELLTPGTFRPNTEADMIFSALADLTAACKSYGQMSVPIYKPAAGSPDFKKCHTTGNGSPVAVVGKKSTATLHAKSSDDLTASLHCELVSEITGTRANCSVKRKGQTQYEISYQPAIKGRHQLHIKVKGQHIRGSPSSVAVKSSAKKIMFGAPILTLGGAEGPRGVAINERGEVVVTEVGGPCVSVFGPSGEKIRSFGDMRGFAQKFFTYPCGVTVDGEGNILVADTLENHIQKFTPEGQFLTTVGTKGSGPLQFSGPTDIAFNTTNNKVYVVDNVNHRVQVLNPNLSFSSTFGKQGNGKGQFVSPWGVACDSTGKVYVADTGNNRIQVFTAKGKYNRLFGRHGQGRGELAEPFYVAVGSGMVYVSEHDNHRVSVFTTEGQFKASFGKRGAGPGEFDCPCGVAVDINGVVYVCDINNKRVQVF